MMRKVGIIRGSPKECLRKLEEEQVDLDNFPLRLKTEALSLFEILNTQVMIVEGSVLHPTRIFEVPLGLMDLEQVIGFSKYPPGIVPYINSAYQVTGKGVIPRPEDIGIPLLTTETFLIIWPLRPGRTRQIGDKNYTLWASIPKEEALKLFSIKAENREALKQILDRVRRMRGGTAKPIFAHTFPEPVEIVEERLTKKIYEPEKARCLEAMTSWRIIVPSTTKNIVSLPVPACFTVIGDVFNIVVVEDPHLTISIAAVLNTTYVRNYLSVISSWVRGETPRVRIREVAVSLRGFVDKIEEVYTTMKQEILKISTLLQQLYEAQIELIAKLAKKEAEQLIKVSETYRACSAMPEKPVKLRGIVNLNEQSLNVQTEKGTIELKFSDADQVANATLIAWLCAGAGLSFQDFLRMPLPHLIDFDIAYRVFVNKPFRELINAAESLFS